MPFRYLYGALTLGGLPHFFLGGGCISNAGLPRFFTLEGDCVGEVGLPRFFDGLAGR
jgi:hypothetical protein